MGLISALIGSAGGVLADQWKEFFYCEAMPFDVLMKKGEKVVGGRSSNTKVCLLYNGMHCQRGCWLRVGGRCS